MSEVVIAESIDNTDEQVYKYTIDMIDINTILFSIMNTDTGINYKLHIKKNSEWCKENLYKTQNDFSQLYQMLNDCVLNDSSMFKYELKEETDHIDFKMEMKNDTKFFKLDLEFKLERHISDNGIIDDRLNSIEYQLNKIRGKNNDNDKIKELENKVNILSDMVNMMGPKYVRDSIGDEIRYAHYNFGYAKIESLDKGQGGRTAPLNPVDYFATIQSVESKSPTGGKWVWDEHYNISYEINKDLDDDNIKNADMISYSKGAWDCIKKHHKWDI